MNVIGTAGHIDHGKSTLVHALTGINPDRLSEEQRRGMTIDLGFAWFTLPSGMQVSVVDVPGHERFIKNMVAGAAGIDVALLVVAADEGIMPQTEEHLDILDLLGVHRGVVALTKSDLVEAEWLELVAEEVGERLEQTGLAGASIIPVSSITGAGLADLQQALDAALLSGTRDLPDALPYLPIDRSFSLSGFGTVVTGTLHGGAFDTGMEVEVVPGGERARIRGMQSHREAVTHADPGTRVAINVAGIAKDAAPRGSVLARPGTIPSTRRVDARVRVLPDAPFALRQGMRVSLHVGSEEVQATLGTVSGLTVEPGSEAWVQLRLHTAIAAVRGQRAVLRLPAPARTVAGAVIVDVHPRRKRFDAAAMARLEVLGDPRLETAVRGAVPEDRPRTSSTISATLTAPVERVRTLLDELVRTGEALHFADTYLAPPGWERTKSRVVRLLAAHHRAYPERQGMPREEVRRRLGWEPAAWAAGVGALAREGIVREAGAELALPDHVGGTAGRIEEAARVLQVLERDPFSPPSPRELQEETGAGMPILMAMVKEGTIVRAGDLFFSAPAFARMTEQTLELIRARGEVTVSDVRDDLGTSRKYVVAFLERLDAARVTLRRGDARILGPKAPR